MDNYEELDQDRHAMAPGSLKSLDELQVDTSEYCIQQCLVGVVII